MAKDIAEALEYSDTEAMTRRLKVIHKTNLQIVGSFKKQLGKDFKHQSEVSLISAKGIYKAIFNSQKPEAEAFQDWVFDILESFRQALGYEQYKIMAFVESVKNHHINMDAIQEILNPENNKPFIKVHSIVNKTMANIIGEPKPISKDEPKKYYPDLLPLRDEILTETVKLMTLKEKFELDFSVSQAIYSKYCNIINRQINTSNPKHREVYFLCKNLRKD